MSVRSTSFQFSVYITFMHLADAFYPKRLTGYTFFCQYVCSLGIEPTTFALLTQCSNHWATGTQSSLQLVMDMTMFSIGSARNRLKHDFMSSMRDCGIFCQPWCHLMTFSVDNLPFFSVGDDDQDKFPSFDQNVTSTSAGPSKSEDCSSSVVARFSACSVMFFLFQYILQCIFTVRFIFSCLFLYSRYYSRYSLDQ